MASEASPLFYAPLLMIYALKSVPGIADVGVLHGDGDGPRTPARCLGGGQEKVSNN